MLDQAFRLRLRFTDGRIGEQGLDLYDGSTSFHGFARALQITTHAFMADEVVGRATALRSGALFFEAPRKGSVLFDITARFKRRPKSAPLNKEVFYDFTTVALERATGNLSVEPQTKYVESRIRTDESFFDDLSEKLEGSLQEAHRSIDNEDVIVCLERPRSTLVEFNNSTSAWVHTREENPDLHEYNGNMTRFNTKTGNGRAYISELDKIVPVRKSEAFNQRNKAWLTWSLHGDNVSTAKELVFRGRQIESASGVTKRLVLDDCWKV
ncbi:hypothetical protein [Sphingomonas sp. OTU376]|uniref:hypothetical protein n=1 Tax=Sphingomonas sp. OTU376 TaxID=3043863 RepID=UPI00313D4578